MSIQRRVNCALSILVLGQLATAAYADEFRPTAQDTIVLPNNTPELLWAEGEFTEGPTVDANGAILFSDIGNRILRFDPRMRATTVFRRDSGKSNGLIHNRQGQLIACEGANGGRRRISITDVAGNVRTLADRYQGKRFNSPNDLAVDHAGRVYFTDPRYVGDEPRELEFEGVFLVDTDGRVTLATRDLEKPNGILVSLDGRHVYVADHNSDPAGNRQLTVFRVEANGTLADKQVLFDFGMLRGIDGMTMDEQGNLYATAGEGEAAGVYVFDPSGRHLALIRTPGTPTNCVFGGPEEPTALYITAAAAANDDQEQRFGLYRIELAIPGHRLFPR